MINKELFKDFKESHKQYEQERKQIIEFSNTVLHASKRVIFAIHRGDMDKATKSLEEIEKTLIESEKTFSHHRLTREGSYRACTEEYVEARIFYNIVTNKKIDKIPNINLESDTYLGGICDVTGELVRFAINKTADGDRDEAKKVKMLINDIMSELVEFDMTGYLRTKYDQAKHSLKKIEQINYEISRTVTRNI